jgi:hypothetical protein
VVELIHITMILEENHKIYCGSEAEKSDRILYGTNRYVVAHSHFNNSRLRSQSLTDPSKKSKRTKKTHRTIPLSMFIITTHYLCFKE